MNTIEINGEKYVKQSEIQETVFADDLEDLKLCVLRTYSAGVWYGYVDYDAENTFSSVVVKQARRIYYWSGAFTLSEVALNGVDEESKIAKTLPEIKLNRVIELIPVTKKCKNIFNGINNYEC